MKGSPTGKNVRQFVANGIHHVPKIVVLVAARIRGILGVRLESHDRARDPVAIGGPQLDAVLRVARGVEQP